MSSAADIPASLFPKPDDDAAKRMKGTYGRKCLEQYEAHGLDGSLPKMLLAILASVSTKLPHRWKLKILPSGRLLFQLAPWARFTAEIDSGLWATPCARDHFPPHSPEYVAAKKAQGHGMRNLNDEVAMWATPIARDSRSFKGGRDRSTLKEESL